MKFIWISLAVLLLTFASWAQTPETNPPAQAPPPPGPMHHGMAGIGPEHMQQMKAQVEKMRSRVDQMKSNLAKIKDPAAKQQAQLDADLWDGMVKHMQAMVDMMSEHEQSGMMHGMMDHDGMAMMQAGCCSEMKGDMKDGGCCSGGKCMKPNAPAGSAPASSGPSK